MTKAKIDKRAALFEELCDVFAPDDANVAKLVSLALADRDAAIAKMKKLDPEWSVQDTTDNIPWVMLTMALVQRKRAFAIHYRAPALDLMRGLATISKALGYDSKKLLAWYDKAHEEKDASDLLEVCGRAFSAFKLAFVFVDTGSELVYLTVIPHAKLSLALSLGRRAQERIVSYWPKVPLTKPLVRTAKTNVTKKAKAKSQKPKKIVLRKMTIANYRESLPIFRMRSGGETFVFGLSSSPPKKIPLSPLSAQSVARSRDGARVLVAGSARGADAAETEHINITSGKTTHDLARTLPRGGKDIEIERVAFVGDVGVLFPSEATYRNERDVKTPFLVEPGAANVSTAETGLPPVKIAKSTSASFAFGSVARTGSGLDVLVWNSIAFVRDPKTKRFERFALLGSIKDHCGSAVPGDGDAFFIAVDNSVREIRRGKPPIKRLKTIDVVVEELDQGEGDAVLVGRPYVNGRKPACVLWWPKDRAYRVVPSKFLGLARRGVILRIGFDAASKLLWWLAGDQLFTLPWSATESLPLYSEDTGRKISQDSVAVSVREAADRVDLPETYKRRSRRARQERVL